MEIRKFSVERYKGYAELTEVELFNASSRRKSPTLLTCPAPSNRPHREPPMRSQS